MLLAGPTKAKGRGPSRLGEWPRLRKASPSPTTRWRCGMPPPPGHLITSVAALAATLVTISVTPNALVKRKLRLSVFLFSAYVILHLVLFVRAEVVPLALDHELRSLEQL